MSLRETSTISLPVDYAFTRLSDVSKWDLLWPDVVNVDVLSGVTQGTGVRFKETRRDGIWCVSRIYEVVEWRQGECLKLLSETPDETISRIITTEAFGPQTRVTLQIERRSRSMTALIRDLVGKVVESAEEVSWRRDLRGLNFSKTRSAAS